MQRWKALAERLVKRDITTLAQCTSEDLRAFALDNLRTPKSREYAGSFLTSVSRLWAFDFYDAQPLGIGEPPWHWEGIDNFLPAATARGENATHPITAATMGPLLIWALRGVDDFAEDILRAWEKAIEMTGQAEATVTNKQGPARIKDYVDARRDRGEPIPSWVQSRERTACIPYISALTGASTGQVDRVLRRDYRSEYVRANLGPSPLKLKIKGRIDGTPWTKTIDFGDAEPLTRHANGPPRAAILPPPTATYGAVSASPWTSWPWMDQRDLALADLAQEHIDDWITGATSQRRYLIRYFLKWTTSRRLTRELTVPSIPSQEPQDLLDDDDRWLLLQSCLTDDALPTDVQAGGAITLLFGLCTERLCHLTPQHLQFGNKHAHLVLGRHPVLLPHGSRTPSATC